ncbi:hypothetical protein ABMA28_016762 [Loxostege sticticalis]|uniref:Uncharacterized protein n=1 Tax=Loxostege sticticalis TaxID=481309 RepID=A0ABD0T5R8_LOXSC
MGSILCLFSHIMYYAEKFTMCLTVATALTCLVFTLLMMLGIGVGLGYNYCFVDIKSKHRYVPGYYRYKVKEATTGSWTPKWRRITTTTKAGPPTNRRAASYVDQKRQLADYSSTVDDRATSEHSSNTEIETSTPSNSEHSSNNEIETTTPYKTDSQIQEPATPSKTVLQIQGLDLIALLSKLKSENINYTLQIATN